MPGRRSSMHQPVKSFQPATQAFLVLGAQLRASALAPGSTSATASRSVPTGRIACGELSLNMVVHGPGLDHLEQRRRAPGHQDECLPDAGPLDLAGSAAVALEVGRTVEAGQDLEEGPVFAGGVPLCVAAAGLEAVAGGALPCGHGCLSEIMFDISGLVQTGKSVSKNHPDGSWRNEGGPVDI